MNNLYKNVKLGGTAIAVLIATSFATAYGQGNGNNQPSGQAGGTGTSNVVVTNSPAQPVPVKDQDNPARQPFHFSAPISVNVAFANVNVPVPAGKRLVIEQISAEVHVMQTSGTYPSFGATAFANGVDGNMWAPMTYVGPGDDGPNYFAIQQVRLYGDPGTNVILHLYKSRDINQVYSGIVSGYISITGYLVNIP